MALSPHDVALLEQTYAITGYFDLVLIGDARSWTPMSENAFNSALRNTLTTAAALIAYGFAATPLVTNTEVTCNSAAEDGATDQGVACT